MKRYETLKVLGKGSFGTALLCRQRDTRQEVVLKVVDISRMKPSSQASARKEAAILRRMNHPAIVSYYDTFEEDGRLVIACEYAAKGDLEHFISKRRGRHFTEKTVLTLLAQMCLGLEYMHAHKVLHRDLKSQNIFLDKHSEVKFGDFGIARVLTHTLEQARTLVGTPYYLSPELCNQTPYSYKSDIWSLGCVVYELCALKHAFEAPNISLLIQRILVGKYEPIPRRYSADLRKLVDLMLSLDPARRPDASAVLRLPMLRPYVEWYVGRHPQLAPAGAGVPSVSCATPRVATGGAGGGAGAGAAAQAGTPIARPSVVITPRSDRDRSCSPDSQRPQSAFAANPSSRPRRRVASPATVRRASAAVARGGSSPPPPPPPQPRESPSRRPPTRPLRGSPSEPVLGGRPHASPVRALRRSSSEDAVRAPRGGVGVRRQRQRPRQRRQRSPATPVLQHAVADTEAPRRLEVPPTPTAPVKALVRQPSPSTPSRRRGVSPDAAANVRPATGGQPVPRSPAPPSPSLPRSSRRGAVGDRAITPPSHSSRRSPRSAPSTPAAPTEQHTRRRAATGDVVAAPSTPAAHRVVEHAPTAQRQAPPHAATADGVPLRPSPRAAPPVQQVTAQQPPTPAPKPSSPELQVEFAFDLDLGTGEEPSPATVAAAASAATETPHRRTDKFLLNGHTLQLPQITAKDSLTQRVEVLRMFLAEHLGEDTLLALYHAAEECIKSFAACAAGGAAAAAAEVTPAAPTTAQLCHAIEEAAVPELPNKGLAEDHAQGVLLQQHGDPRLTATIAKALPQQRRAAFVPLVLQLLHCDGVAFRND